MTRADRWSAKVAELVGTCADAAGAVAVLPDGARLAIGHGDGTLRCVDLATGDTLWFGAERHEPVLQSLACSPDGRLLATAADDLLVSLWDAASGTVVGQQDHANTVLQVCFAPTGNRFATAGADGTVGVFRPDGGEREVSCEGHEGWVQSVDWSPQGDRVASASNDRTLRIWDAATGTEVEQHAMGARANAVAWSPVRDRLAVGLETGDVVLLDLGKPDAEVLRFRADEGGVNSLTWTRDGRAFASAGDKAVRVFDASGNAGHLSRVLDERGAVGRLRS